MTRDATTQADRFGYSASDPNDGFSDLSHKREMLRAVESQGASPRALRGTEDVLVLGLVVWLVCPLPVAVLIGYCALGEERVRAEKDEALERAAHGDVA